jgi:DNA helicase-2/ATP-dependent DNA helicase PcrA
LKQPNKEQTEAIRHRDGPMLVLAGPGTGKTTVIAGRTAALVSDGVPAGSILVVTFTRAAAAEMRSRIRALLAERADGAAIGTFHGIFYGMLKKVYRIQSGTVIGAGERNSLIRALIAQIYPDGLRESDLPEQVGREISLVKTGRIRLSNYYSGALPDEIFRKLAQSYAAELKKRKQIDFDDLILLCWQMLKTRPEIRKRWQNKWKYILIDEFQDISPLQYEVMRMLALPENNLFIVGDDDQSIYRFRGANPSIMLNFNKDYPDAQMIALRKNYRSTPEIVWFASRVIRSNRNRFDKPIEAVRPSGRPVRLRVFRNLYEEAEFLARHIRKKIDCGIDPDRIAVLVRTNAGARHVIERFLSDRIPFRALETIPCIYDHWVARDILTYLEIANGSTSRANFLRICNRPLRYLSREAFTESDVSFEHLYNYYREKEWMKKRIARFENDIRTIRHLSPYGAICYIRKSVGYDEYLANYADEHGMPAGALTDVLDEIADSARSCRSYAEWKTRISEYRAELREMTDVVPEHGVMISTLHAAKGTEYDLVYLIDANDGVIPHKKAVLDVDIEEERRMFYVGLTRARDELFITAVQNRYGKDTDLSPFLSGFRIGGKDGTLR